MPTSPYEFSAVFSTAVIGSSRAFTNVIHDPHIISDLYSSLNPVVLSYWLTLLLVAFQAVVSLVTRTISINDRLWPIIPLLHVVLYAAHPSSIAKRNARLYIMCALVSVWGIRLFVNAVRRGVYNANSTDYRYKWLRENVITNSYLYAMFHVAFTCTFCTVLLSVVSVGPLYFAWLSLTPLNYVDSVASITILVAIAVETVADEQMQNFQHFKRCSNKQTDGFITTGLFSRCRHPNFAAEITIWFAFYLFSVACTSHNGLNVFNWLIVAPFSYLVLFQGSTAITEYLSMKKYPMYKQYQQRVPKLHFSLFSSYSAQPHSTTTSPSLKKQN